MCRRRHNPSAVAPNRQLWGHDKVRGTQGTGDNQWFTPSPDHRRRRCSPPGRQHLAVRFQRPIERGEPDQACANSDDHLEPWPEREQIGCASRIPERDLGVEQRKLRVLGQHLANGSSNCCRIERSIGDDEAATLFR